MQEIKRPTNLAPLRIPRLINTKVTKKGRVPRITGDSEDFVGPVDFVEPWDEERVFSVCVPGQKGSAASDRTEKPLSASSPERKRSMAPGPPKKPSTASSSDPKGSAASDRTEKPLSASSPERKRSMAPGPPEKPSTASSFDPKRSAAPEPAEKPSIVSILLEKRLPVPVKAEEVSEGSGPARKSSPNVVPSEERSMVSALLEDRLAASAEDKAITASDGEDHHPRPPRRHKQHVGPLEKVNLAAGKVRNASPGVEVKPAAVPNAPKLLKVIRRRGEQAPKVFEAAASRVPKSMLRGLKANPEEDFESPLD